MSTASARRRYTAHARATPATMAVRTGAGDWMVAMTSVCQVVPYTTLTPLPLAPAAVLGLLPWRGQAVPVLHPPGTAAAPSVPHAAAPATLVVLLQLPAQQSVVGLPVLQVLPHAAPQTPWLDLEAWWQNARLST